MRVCVCKFHGTLLHGHDVFSVQYTGAFIDVKLNDQNTENS